ncbi:MAG TPA: hypothetical protein VF039_13840 [Longimicrobiales bacterium]
MPYDGGLLPLFRLSGALAVPVLALLVLALGLIVTIGRRVRGAIRNDDEVLQRVELHGRQDRLEDAAGVAHATSGAAAAVVAAGLAAPDAEPAMRAAIATELDRLARGSRLLDWTGALAALVPGAALVLADAPTAPLAALALGLGVAILVALARWAIVAGLRRAELDMEKAAALVHDIRPAGPVSR